MWLTTACFRDLMYVHFNLYYCLGFGFVSCGLSVCRLANGHEHNAHRMYLIKWSSYYFTLRDRLSESQFNNTHNAIIIISPVIRHHQIQFLINDDKYSIQLAFRLCKSSPVNSCKEIIHINTNNPIIARTIYPRDVLLNKKTNATGKIEISLSHLIRPLTLNENTAK